MTISTLKSKIGVFIISFLLLFGSCEREPLIIKNPRRESDIQRMLMVQKELTSKSVWPIWEFQNWPLSQSEMQAMEFLYAYMPLSDMADYTNDFFLKNVQMSLKARDEMPWGNDVPEEEFLHFVLPLRVNNENLDNFREVMYPEIKERVKGLDMKQAVLEINHWCHEKVSYRGTDSRTSAPLSTIKKSFGRCGEESTFTVTALRTAGIPARQVYTPRWAHTDDNHAWVEVWVNGKWEHIGACEPEPDFKIGWYVVHSTRVMLVHTRVYGRYFGHEPVLDSGDRYSELNLTSHYAPVKQISVTVRNSKGEPVDSARVEFQLYNYAEFYPLATCFTNKDGVAGFISGLGDLIVWAAKDGEFAYNRLSVRESDSLELILNQTLPDNESELFDLIPPPAGKTESVVTERIQMENDRRLAEEDSIRNSYMNTFIDSTRIVNFAEKNRLPIDTISRFLKLSYGNWDQIEAYLEKNTATYRSTALEMANQIADKDFSDTPESILTDHLVQTEQSGIRNMVPSTELYTKYILNPRIALENLSPWRSFLVSAFGQEMAQATRNNISVITKWINDNITVNTIANKHSRTPLTPIGVYNLRVADPHSRDIFFVAACRTFGIPARLNPETRFPEYLKNGEWFRIRFDDEPEQLTETGFLKLLDKNNNIVPKYYTHFTIGNLRKGFLKTLEYNEGEMLTDRITPLVLETGRYAIITGNRMDDDGVLSKMDFFTINKGELTIVPVELRKYPVIKKSFGKLDLSRLKIATAGSGNTLSLEVSDSNTISVLILLEPDKEPSKHILNDVSVYSDYYDHHGVRFVLVTPAQTEARSETLKTYRLPSNKEFGTDTDNNLINSITEIFGTSFKNKLPLVLIYNSSGDVYMFSSGYKIGIGEQINTVIQNIKIN